jgi:hypothetical protein
MFSCKNMIVIVVAMFLILYVLKDDTSKLVVGLATMFFLYKNKFSFREGLDVEPKVETNVKIVPPIISNNTVSAGGAKPGPLVEASTVNTGPYDGLCLKTGNEEYWMKSPDETALVPDDTLYTYLSSQGPIKMKLSDQSALYGPPIDGVPGSYEKMFILANNTASPLCCPSTFSTSTGCVCTTKNQRDFIAGRGNIVNGAKDMIEI